MSPEQIDSFVAAVSGKKLSVREIEQLAHGFFRGPEPFRREILKGNLALSLDQSEASRCRSRSGVLEADPGCCCSEFERVLLKDLELDPKLHAAGHGKKSGSHDSRAGPFTRSPIC